MDNKIQGNYRDNSTEIADSAAEFDVLGNNACE